MPFFYTPPEITAVMRALFICRRQRVIDLTFRPYHGEYFRFYDISTDFARRFSVDAHDDNTIPPPSSKKLAALLSLNTTR